MMPLDRRMADSLHYQEQPKDRQTTWFVLDSAAWPKVRTNQGKSTCARVIIFNSILYMCVCIQSQLQQDDQNPQNYTSDFSLHQRHIRVYDYTEPSGTSRCSKVTLADRKRRTLSW